MTLLHKTLNILAIAHLTRTRARKALKISMQDKGTWRKSPAFLHTVTKNNFLSTEFKSSYTQHIYNVKKKIISVVNANLARSGNALAVF